MTTWFPARKRTWRDRFADCGWVPLAIVAAFLVVFAANGSLVYFALESWPGLTTDHAYDEGLAYNRVIEETDKQARLGWTLAVDFRPDAKGVLNGQIELVAADRDKRPLDRLRVRAELIRPLEELPPVVVALKPLGAGHYAAAVALPRAGQWDIYVAAERDGQAFRTGRRLVVP